MKGESEGGKGRGQRGKGRESNLVIHTNRKLVFTDAEGCRVSAGFHSRLLSAWSGYHNNRPGIDRQLNNYTAISTA